MNFYEQSGAGPILFFVPGFPNNRLLWRRQWDVFHSRAHLVFGEFNGASFQTILTRASQKLKSLREAFPHRKIYVIGHDVGCFVVNELTASNPEAVNGQIFINGVSLAQYASRVFAIKQWMKSSYVILLNSPLTYFLRFSWVQHFVSKLAYDTAAVSDSSSIRSPVCNQFSHAAIYRDLTRLVWHKILNPRHINKKNPVRTLIIHANSDPFLIQPSRNELTAGFAVADLRVLNIGHWSPFTDADSINHYIEHVCFEGPKIGEVLT